MNHPLPFSIIAPVTAALLLACVPARANITNTLEAAVNIDDAKDHGCEQTPLTVGKPCRDCQKSPKGMPYFWVTEPNLNLWLADEPAAYTTSLGENIAFRLTYKQRSFWPSNVNPTNPTYNARVPTTLSPDWSHGWFSYIRFFGTCVQTNEPRTGLTYYYHFTNWTATVCDASGGQRRFGFNHRFDSGTALDLMPMDGIDEHVYAETGRVINGPPKVYGKYGFRLVFPDGSQDLYGETTMAYVPETNGFTLSRVYGDAMLTERVDAHGNSTRFYYSNYLANGQKYFLLGKVVDYDGRTNTLCYSNGLLVRVDMPYGRSASLEYSNGRLYRVTDAESNSSTFGYDPATGWLTNLTTPYGTTAFAHTDSGTNDNGVYVGNMGGTNRISRALRITKPDLSKELYLYRYGSSQVGLPEQFSPSLVPVQTPIGTLDDGNESHVLARSYLRNSYYWDSRQYAALSTEALASLTAADYNLATTKHWLAETDPSWLSSTLSWVRAPSPDKVQAGHLTWLDYAGKSDHWIVGTNTQVGVAATRLPGDDTQYARVEYETNGMPGTLTTTYTTPSGTDTRSFSFIYTNLTASENCNVQGFDQGTVFWRYPALMKIVGPNQETRLGLSGFTNVTSVAVRTNYGNQTIFTFTNTLPRRLTLEATNALGETSTAFFNLRQQLTGFKLASGLTRTNLYGADGFLSQTIDLETSATNRFAFDKGLLAKRTNELGLVTSYTWDNLERLTSIGFPDNTTNAFKYDRLDLVGQQDRLGRWTWLGYDSLQHLRSVTDPRSNVTQLAWCGCGGLESITDALTNTTRFFYNNQGLLTNVLYGDGTRVTNVFDSVGRLTKSTDALGRPFTFGYHNQGRIAWMNNPTGRLFSASYDIYDRPWVVSDAENVTVTHGYDALNRLTSRVWQDGIGETFGYWTNGLVAYTNRDSKVTKYTRDEAGRLKTVTNPNLEVTQLAYNPLGQVTDLWDGRTNHTRWAYDPEGRLTNKVDASNQEVLRLAWYANGLPQTRWTPQFGTTTYSYDAAGNLTNVSSLNPQPSTLGYAYDALNRLAGMTDAVGASTFGYSPAGQLALEDGPWSNDAVTVAYSQQLRQSLSLEQPGAPSWALSYGYDMARRLDVVSSPAGAFGYSYNVGTNSRPGSLVTGIKLPNLAYITNRYDSLARLESTALLNQWGHVLDGHTYSHDPLGLRTAVVRDLGVAASTVAVGYDAIGQLTSWSAQESNGGLRHNEQFTWAYDASHNLSTRASDGLVQTFTSDSLNQLNAITRAGTLTLSGALAAPVTNLTVNGQTADPYADLTFARTNLTLNDGNNSFTNVARNAYGVGSSNVLTLNLPATVSLHYDLNGNLTSDGTRVFAYDAENQLVAVSVAGQWRVEFVYDGLGRRRITREYGSNWATPTNEVRLVYDGMLPMQERNGANQPLVTYTRGSDFSGGFQGAGGIGGLLARTDGSGSVFYHADGAGNITALMDPQQNVAARYLYGPFGNLLGKWGPMAEANRYRFSSKEVHPTSGLYYYGFRFYDPALQRWLSQDPLGERGGLNLYGFAGNSPSGLVDPYGLLFGSSFEEAGRWVYDQMMGRTPGQYNQDTYGAQRGDLLEGIDRNDNVLKDSLGEAARLAGDQGTDAALNWGLGKAIGVLGELGGALWDKVKRLKCLKWSAGPAKELLGSADKLGREAAKTAPTPRLPGPTVDPVTGQPVGRFIGPESGPAMIEPVGGRTVAAGKGGVDTHTLYPNGANYQRLNPAGHANNPTPHAHGHAPGTGPGMKGQGPSLDTSGNVVPWNSPDAHWPFP